MKRLNGSTMRRMVGWGCEIMLHEPNVGLYYKNTYFSTVNAIATEAIPKALSQFITPQDK